MHGQSHPQPHLEQEDISVLRPNSWIWASSVLFLGGHQSWTWTSQSQRSLCDRSKTCTWIFPRSQGYTRMGVNSSRLISHDCDHQLCISQVFLRAQVMSSLLGKSSPGVNLIFRRNSCLILHAGSGLRRPWRQSSAAPCFCRRNRRNRSANLCCNRID